MIVIPSCSSTLIRDFDKRNRIIIFSQLDKGWCTPLVLENNLKSDFEKLSNDSNCADKSPNYKLITK